MVIIMKLSIHKLLQLLISSEIGLFWGGTHLTAFVIVQSFNLRLSSIVPAYLPLEKLNLFIMILGVILYGGVGLVSIYYDAEYLNYSILAHDTKHGQHIGILLIEFGVGLTVAGVMLILFHLFSSWQGKDK